MAEQSEALLLKQLAHVKPRVRVPVTGKFIYLETVKFYRQLEVAFPQNRHLELSKYGNMCVWLPNDFSHYWQD